jgi:hypothetical protein
MYSNNMTSLGSGTWMLLLLLSFFCFNAVVFTGADGQGLEAEARRPISHHKGNSSLLFDVKRFGARADGRTDDSKVCFLYMISSYKNLNKETFASLEFPICLNFHS